MREGFVNVAVVLYSQQGGFLRCASHLDTDLLLAFAPDLDLDLQAVEQALAAVDAVCHGDGSSGLVAGADPGRRFGYLAAPRSTVVQPSPVHGGLVTGAPPDPDALLDHLLTLLIRRPAEAPDLAVDGG